MLATCIEVLVMILFGMGTRLYWKARQRISAHGLLFVNYLFLCIIMVMCLISMNLFRSTWFSYIHHKAIGMFGVAVGIFCFVSTVITKITLRYFYTDCFRKERKQRLIDQMSLAKEKTPYEDCKERLEIIREQMVHMDYNMVCPGDRKMERELKYLIGVHRKVPFQGVLDTIEGFETYIQNREQEEKIINDLKKLG